MIKILLACSAGMSTSLLEKAMKDHAANIGIECEIIAQGSETARQVIKNYDICLLGPQVRFMESQFKSEAGDVPIVVIPPQIYALADGEQCLKLAMDNIKK
ncbi:PTS sugar transporter subunit IIB [Malacoplasma iowae]|uniref:PTS system, cellobiose-specific, IIB component n=2 Tax=Malacoplasma iowae TaxID=2116 RepID=A0A084U4I8_MALIO|nr:PTS sugar transporter subunit IIB [Malacoplasma iowae]VEU61590.1 Oligo-beta-mannoside-specific phosphotransferase enzyme IIB component [Mycoplasmopsis fermentans]EGZ31686.1 phosphotransferase system cellobiose-specific component IIB [Malacoplasma iowae 695]KFB07874.1 PTS system, cellobiose-specific, IIB component [Malacoplasma iowae DK-CPA]QHG89318.1 PTS sugar transporter subunit IIB [Malacoplasma iowae 695]WPL35983.1 PTS sugar transporter subunit IIB [Malacoplasma iowae]